MKRASRPRGTARVPSGSKCHTARKRFPDLPTSNLTTQPHPLCCLQTFRPSLSLCCLPWAMLWALGSLVSVLPNPVFSSILGPWTGPVPAGRLWALGLSAQADRALQAGSHLLYTCSSGHTACASPCLQSGVPQGHAGNRQKKSQPRRPCWESALHSSQKARTHGSQALPGVPSRQPAPRQDGAIE